MLENELDQFQTAMEEKEQIIDNLRNENDAILDQFMGDNDK